MMTFVMHHSEVVLINNIKDLLRSHSYLSVQDYCHHFNPLTASKLKLLFGASKNFRFLTPGAGKNLTVNFSADHQPYFFIF